MAHHNSDYDLVITGGRVIDMERALSGARSDPGERTPSKMGTIIGISSRSDKYVFW
jgi:hypothetical protein